MKKLGIYIHIPFCKSKCTYCNFYSQSSDCLSAKDIIIQTSIIEAINREIELFVKSEEYLKNKQKYYISTIYFGGGTPSYIDADMIISIIKTIQREFAISDKDMEKIEVTIEANPDSITKEKLDKYYENGINRLSVGLQAYNDRLLGLMGRPYNCKIFDKCVEIINQSRFKNWSLDLIFGLPNQSMKDWTNTLEKAISFSPKHISCYSLEVHRNTILGRNIKTGKMPNPDEILDRKMYHRAVKILADNHYFQYEISNFAKKGYKCRHNLDFWNRNSYIGFGPSACSTFEGESWCNISENTKYIDKVNGSKVFDSILISDVSSDLSKSHSDCSKRKLYQKIMLGIRLNKGVIIYSKEYSILIKNISKLRSNGLLMKDKNIKKLILTQKGRDLADYVIEQLLENV